MRFGFDISTYQDSPLIAGNVDFAKMRDYGASFVIIRAGQGNWKDEDFDRSWDNAKGILPRNSYFFFDNRYPPKVQAQTYFDIIKRDPEGYCWLDLEHTVTGNYGRWQDWYDFLAEFRRLCDYPVGIYTGYWYFMDKVKFATLAQKQYFGKYPLWLASYPADPFNVNHALIRIPYPWTRYVMLQSGTPAIGEATGVESRDIDYNIWMKDEEFATFFSGATEPPTEPEPGETMERWKVTWANGANRRPQPNVNNDPITPKLLVNTEFDVIGYHVPPGMTEAQERWGRLVDLTWVALTYNNQTRAVLVSAPPPAEPTFPPEFVVRIGTQERTYILKP